jgi:hypothetical protein
MRIKRRLPLVLVVLLVAAAVAIVVQLRKHAPPEPARLLPGADAFLYVNLKWVRTVNAASQLPRVPHDPEYEQFIQETGFQFERDLDEAAFAVHYPPSSAVPEKGAPAAQPRFSEVFVGKINGERLTAYLRKLAKSVDVYNSIDIFNIPLEGRTVRVAILGVGSVAVSNHDDPLVIRGIVDRSRKLASPFAGPSFLRHYYKYVPIASLAWVIARIEPGREPSFDSPVGSLALLFSKPAVLLISARYIRALHLKAEAFTASPDEAKAVADKVGTFLNVFHAAETSVAPRGGDQDVKTFFDSLKVEQEKDRAVLTATVPAEFLRKAIAEAPGAVAPSPEETPKLGTPPGPTNQPTERKNPTR